MHGMDILWLETLGNILIRLILYVWHQVISLVEGWSC